LLELPMTDNDRARLALKVKMRQETNIDPAAINADTAELYKIFQVIDLMEARLKERGVYSDDRWLPTSSLRHDCEDALREFRKDMTSFLVQRYRQRYLPNMELDSDDFLSAMKERVGEERFDAEVIEDNFGELMQTGREQSLEQMLSKARRLLPYFSENVGPSDRVSQILDGRRLMLRVYLQRYDRHQRGGYDVSLGFEAREEIVALGKLSKVILNNEDPVSVESNICEAVPVGLELSQRFQGKMPGDDPIVSMRFHMNGKFIVEYATAERARKMGEVFIKKTEH